MANIAQRSFAKGEISPALYARTDQVAYATGLRTCRNFRVLRQGGVENRPGTVLVGATPGGAVVRLLPFIFNAAQTYVLEFSHHALRFIRNGAYIGSPYSLATPYDAADLPELRITQSADVVTIVHPSYAPRNLSRLADDNWTLTAVTFAPQIAAPTGVTLSPDPGGTGTFIQWVVTAIDAETGQEGFASSVVGVSSILQKRFFTPVITWAAVTGAKSYNIYKGGSSDGSIASDLGFIGSTGTTSFSDTGLTPDMLNRAPIARNPFDGANHWPSAVTYFQARRCFGATNTKPETLYTSRSGDYNNFTVSTPSQDDDALTLTLAAKQVSRINHLLDHVALYVFTDGGEWALVGDQSGVLRPSELSALNFSKHGASRLPPIPIGARILFVQARESIVRDIAQHPVFGYQGNDLTLMATHLFDGYTLVDWAYQEVPHSIVWAVRSDGTLLGLTDVAEQEILAWHRHDTLGTFENVCVIPEGTEDAVYVCVNRDGNRYVERFVSRYVADVVDAIFLDSALSYDGRNTEIAQTLTLSGGATWASDELLTLTANSSRFTSATVGDAFVLTGLDADGARVDIPLRVTAYVSGTVVQGFPDRTVPASLQGVATTAWSRAVATVTGLEHLNGYAVGVFADGVVAASPNNPDYPVVTVSGGSVTLDRPYSVIHVGLPYVSDLETLDIDTPSGPSLKEKKLLLSKLTLMVESSRGIFVGPEAPDDETTTGLTEWKARNTEAYGEPVALRTDTIDVNMQATWKTAGRAFVRQVDPVPLTILGVIPTGSIPSPSA